MEPARPQTSGTVVFQYCNDLSGQVVGLNMIIPVDSPVISDKDLPRLRRAALRSVRRRPYVLGAYYLVHKINPALQQNVLVCLRRSDVSGREAEIAQQTLEDLGLTVKNDVRITWNTPKELHFVMDPAADEMQRIGEDQTQDRVSWNM